MLRIVTLVLVAAASSCLAAAPDAAPATRPAEPEVAPSRIVAVTVYQSSALVSRQVTVPRGVGVTEVVVGPLPASTVESSLYSEGSDGLRILSTRYRTRVLRENVAEDVRALQTQLKDLAEQDQVLQQEIATAQQNLQLMGKMDEFTAGSLKQLTEKGQLNAEAVVTLADYIIKRRTALAAEIVQKQQAIAGNKEKAVFVQAQLGKLSGTSDRTIRDAIIVVDRAGADGTVSLNYIVSAASWRPQYKLRAAAAKDKPEAQLEYMGAINQQTGEDWTGVDLSLSTALPTLNAAPPELAVLGVSIGASAGRMYFEKDTARKEAQQLRQKGQQSANVSSELDARRDFNEAAAIEQAYDFLYASADKKEAGQGQRGIREGQSVTFHLATKITVPWRDDEQLVEVARLSMKPDYFYKAVPVLTEHVYRLANLVNDSQYVILPGEAAVYVGTDFVGRSSLPLVAIGEQFTAGFGVDPQLQVSRTLVEKTRGVQGGNQVIKYDYRLAVSSYKSEPVKMQVWDRLPHAEHESINVALVESKPDLSKDPAYQREERTKNLLRWDLAIDPNTSGEKSTVLTYQFRLEYDKNLRLADSPNEPGQPAAAPMEMLQFKNR